MILDSLACHRSLFFLGPSAGMPRPRNYTTNKAEQQAYFPWGSKLARTNISLLFNNVAHLRAPMRTECDTGPSRPSPSLSVFRGST